MEQMIISLTVTISTYEIMTCLFLPGLRLPILNFHLLVNPFMAVVMDAGSLFTIPEDSVRCSKHLGEIRSLHGLPVLFLTINGTMPRLRGIGMEILLFTSMVYQGLPQIYLTVTELIIIQVSTLSSACTTMA